MTNYKTIQSFGHNEVVIKTYEDLMRPVYESTLSAHVKTSMAFGLSQLGQYVVFGCMFFVGGKVVENYGADPENVFIAMFAIMFGAQQLGGASAFGPDMGKAKGASERIFEIIDFPSSINAIAIDEEKEFENKKRISNIEDIKGKVEFKNVWFRYPTRKEDFVL